MRTVEHQRGSGPRWAAVLAGLVLLALLAGACGGESADPSPTTTSVAATSEPAPTTTSTASTTTTKVLTDEEAVRATIDQYWVESAAQDPPDPTRPGLLAVVAGSAEEKITAELLKYQALEQGARRADGTTIVHETRSVTFEGDIAVARECAIDDMVARTIPTGEIVDQSVHSLLIETKLHREAGRWVVFTSRTLKNTEQVPPVCLDE